jgi:tetratricopeptide (TPR) repeat protein
MTMRVFAMSAVLVALVGIVALSGCRSAHTTSAILYIEAEQYQKAIDVIEEGLYYSPGDYEAYYYQGEAYSRMAQKAIDDNDYLQAKRSFEEAYERYMRSLQMNPEAMRERVAEALDFNYRNTLREGQGMWREEHYEEAEGYFRLAYAALPDSLDSIKNIASMKIQQAERLPGDTEKPNELRNEALELLDQVLAANPGAYRLQADKAYVLTQLDRTGEAQAIYETLLREHGDDPDLLLDVVGLYIRQERFEEAGDLFMKVAGIFLNDTDPENDSQLKGLYTEAGYNYRLAGKYEQAIESYGLASEQDVYDIALLLERQQLFLLQGQELLEEARLALEEGDTEGSNELEARALAVLQRGVEVSNAVTSLAPNNPDGFYFLANIQALLGNETGFQENMATYNELTGIQ